MQSKTCVYYELNSITEDDVCAVCETFDIRQTVHLHKDTSAFPKLHQVRSEVIGSERSPEYRNQLMNRLDRVFDQVRSDTRFNKPLMVNGIDLLEVVRFDFFFPFSYIVHSVWVLEQIIERFSPALIIWVSADKDSSTPLHRGVEIYLRKRGINLINWQRKPVPAAVSGAGDWWLFWKTVLWEVKKSLLEASSSLIRKPYLKLSEAFRDTDILFLENFPNSAKISAAVARELESAGQNYCFAATSSSALDAAGDLNRKMLIGNILKPAVWIEIAWRQIRVSILARKVVRMFFTGSTSSWGSSGSLLDNEVTGVIAKSFRRATELIINNSVLLTLLEPKVVTTTNSSNSFSRAIAALANKQGTETFLIQHGYPNFDDFENHLLHKKVLVWGKSGINDWVRFGIRPENIIITGSPKFVRDDIISTDTLHSQKQPIKVTYFPSLVEGSSMSEEISVRALDMVLKTFKDKKDVRLTIKTKIQDKFTIINKFKNFNNINIIKERDAVDVINESDIVIVTTSNVGLEACVIGKPLIVLMFSGIRERLFSFYEKFGCALFATTDEELQNAVEKIIYNKKIRYRLLKGRGFFVNDVFNGCKPGVVKRMAATLIMSE